MNSSSTKILRRGEHQCRKFLLYKKNSGGLLPTSEISPLLEWQGWQSMNVAFSSFINRIGVVNCKRPNYGAHLFDEARVNT